MISLELIALSCEYLSSQEILYIIDDYKLSYQGKGSCMINKKFIDLGRYKQILPAIVFKFPKSMVLYSANYPGLNYLSSNLASSFYTRSVDWIFLSSNPASKSYMKLVDWLFLSTNPAAIKLLEENK